MLVPEPVEGKDVVRSLSLSKGKYQFDKLTDRNIFLWSLSLSKGLMLVPERVEGIDAGP